MLDVQKERCRVVVWEWILLHCCSRVQHDVNMCRSISARFFTMVQAIKRWNVTWNVVKHETSISATKHKVAAGYWTPPPRISKLFKTPQRHTTSAVLVPVKHMPPSLRRWNRTVQQKDCPRASLTNEKCQKHNKLLAALRWSFTMSHFIRSNLMQLYKGSETKAFKGKKRSCMLPHARIGVPGTSMRAGAGCR